MEPKVIVSLTTFPEAAKYSVKAIESILSGSKLPDKIVLYLTLDQFKDIKIPKELLKLEKVYDIFEIRDYSKDIRSYRKLIPALQDFPEAVIVTIDDDVYYDRNMLRDLINMHRQYPDAIIANRAKVISPSKRYQSWKKLRWYHFINNKIKISPLIIQTGVGGVLYPPHSLKPNMLDEKLFTEIAPTTDDIWFWAAAISNGRNIIPYPYGKHNKPKAVGKPKEISLKTVNFKSGSDRNDKAFQAILKHFPQISDLLKQFK